jgi:hypothetical protein
MPTMQTRRYNGDVERRSIEPPEDPGTESRARNESRYRIYRAETVGLLLIAAVLLVITLIRYWHHINWSAR